MGSIVGKAAIVAGLVCSIAEAVLAGVQVLDDNGAAIPASAWSCEPGSMPDSWVVTLNERWNPWGNTWFRVKVDAGEDIDQLLIDVDGPPAGSPVTITVGEAGSPVRRINSIRQQGSAEVVLHQLNVVESLGAVEVQAINFMDIAGHVIGPLVVTETSSELRGIRRLDIAGDLLGDVLVAHGTIRELVVLGDVGTQEDPIRIEAGNGLWTMDVRGDINACIDLCHAGNTGFLHRLSADDFNGMLTIDRLAKPAGSDAPPMLSLTGWLSGTWSIAGSLQNSEAHIELPSEGLRGQVIINANAAEQASWSTPVTMQAGNGLPAIALQGPVYEALPSEIGGGSVGLVPYRVHARACVPPSGSVLDPSVFDGQLTLRFYGPVSLGWGDPLIFEHRAAYSDADFVQIPSSDFCVQIDEADASQIHITPAGGWGGFQPGAEYRLRPTSSLLCAAPVSSPVSQEVVYQIAIESSDCHADVDGSGIVDMVDLLLVLALWGQGGTPASAAGDIDDNGTVGVDDLLIIVAHWGQCA